MLDCRDSLEHAGRSQTLVFNLHTSQLLTATQLHSAVLVTWSFVHNHNELHVLHVHVSMVGDLVCIISGGGLTLTTNKPNVVG